MYLYVRCCSCFSFGSWLLLVFMFFWCCFATVFVADLGVLVRFRPVCCCCICCVLLSFGFWLFFVFVLFTLVVLEAQSSPFGGCVVGIGCSTYIGRQLICFGSVASSARLVLAICLIILCWLKKIFWHFYLFKKITHNCLLHKSIIYFLTC